MVAPAALQTLAERWDAIPADKRAHVAALVAAAADYAGIAPAPKKAAPLPPCAWRGALLDRCQCGDPMRDVWECREPGMLAPGGGPGKATGRLCANCKLATGMVRA